MNKHKNQYEGMLNSLHKEEQRLHVIYKDSDSKLPILMRQMSELRTAAHALNQLHMLEEVSKHLNNAIRLGDECNAHNRNHVNITQFCKLLEIDYSIQKAPPVVPIINNTPIHSTTEKE